MAWLSLAQILRPRRAATHPWFVAGAGAQARTARFAVLPLGAPGPDTAGVFLFVRRQGDGARVPVYAGESACVGARLVAHETLADALLIGASELHVLAMAGGADARRAAAERLIAFYDPVLNRPATRTRAAV